MIWGLPAPVVPRSFTLRSSEQVAERTSFWFPVWRSRRGLSSRRLCGRGRKPRLEPDVRSSRFVSVREIPNATPFRAATFTRTTLRSIKCQTQRLSDFLPPTRLFGRTECHVPSAFVDSNFTQSRRLVRSHRRPDLVASLLKDAPLPMLTESAQTEDGHAMMKFDTL